MSNFSSVGLGVIVGATLGRSYTNTLSAAGKQAGRLGEQWQKTNARLRAAGDVVKYRTRLDELRKKQQALGRSSSRLTDGIRETERRYREAKRAARQYGIAVGAAADEQKRLARQLARTETAQRGQALRQRGAGRLGALRGAALGMAGAGYAAARVVGGAMAREEQALYLRSVIGAPDKDAAVGRAVAHAREFARGSLASEEEMLEIQYQLGSADLDEEAARTGGEMVHKLAKVTRGAAGQVAEVVGITYNNMLAKAEGTTEEKMLRLGNVLAKTQMKFQIKDFGQLGESLSEAASGASSAKLPFESMAAAVGLLNSAGQQGSEAGTALKAVLKNLTKAGEELGTTVVRTADGQLNLVATLQQIKDATDGLDTDSRADLLREIFGDEGEAGIVPLLDKLDNFKAGLEELRAVSGSGMLSEEYQRFLNSGAGQWKMLTDNVTMAGQAFAGVLLPSVNALLRPVAGAAASVGVLAEQVPALSYAAGGLAIGLTAVAAAAAVKAAGLWALGAATSGWAATTEAASWAGMKYNAVIRATGLASYAAATARWRATAATRTWTVAQWLAAGAGSALARGVGAISRALRLQVAWSAVVAGATRAWTVAQWLLNVALNANPIGLVVAGAAALVGVGYLIYKHWDRAKSLFSAFWPVLLALLGPLGAIVGAVILLWKHWDKLTGAIGRGWERVNKFFGGGDDEQVGDAAPSPVAAPTPSRGVAPAAAAATFAAAATVGVAAAPAPVVAPLALEVPSPSAPVFGAAAPPVAPPEFPAIDIPTGEFPAADIPPPTAGRTVVIRVDRPVIEVHGDLDPDEVAVHVQREFEAILRRAAAEADLAEDDG